MRKLQTTALVDEAGTLSVEISTDLAPGAHKLTLLVDETNEEELDAAQVRQHFRAFLADWDAHEMSEYDEL